MKTIFVLILAFSAYGQSTDDTTKKTDSKKVTKVPEPFVIPKDATPLPDGSFRYVDKDGKKWIYRSTPFGVSKSEERPVAPVVQQTGDDPTKSQDLGDSVRFTRPTPFGPKVWTAKKTELSSYEKGIWDRDQQKNEKAAPPVASKPDAPKQD